MRTVIYSGVEFLVDLAFSTDGELEDWEISDHKGNDIIELLNQESIDGILAQAKQELAEYHKNDFVDPDIDIDWD